jgi:hypothetical protein
MNMKIVTNFTNTKLISIYSGRLLHRGRTDKTGMNQNFQTDQQYKGYSKSIGGSEAHNTRN